MTTNKETERIVRSWLEPGLTTLTDDVLDPVLDQLPATPQRRPWWPARRFESMNTHAKFALAAAAVVAVLVVGAQLFGPAGNRGVGAGPMTTPEPSVAAPDLSAGPPGVVTGQLVWDDNSGGEFQEEVDVEGGFKQRVRERTAHSEMSDARLTGAVKVIDNADRFSEGVDLLWGTVAIENDQGSWTGTLTGTSDPSVEGRGVSYIELVGAGGYEGLSAVLFEREEPLPQKELDWNGVIFSGNLPPDR